MAEPAAKEARLSRMLAAARRTRRVHLYRSSYALMLTTAGNAALGLVFWIAAARLYPSATVGLGAGGISALQLAATVGWVGLQFTVLRYVPVAGSRRAALVASLYAVAATVAIGIAVVFVAVATGPLHVVYIGRTVLGALLFCAGAGMWVVFSLQDAVLVAIRRTFFVPVENATYGLLKLLLLVGFAWIDSPWTLLGVWMASAGVLTLAINALLFIRLLRHDETAPALPDRRTIARFSAGHTAVAVSSWAPDLLVPLLVLRYLGAAQNAYYYAAWAIGFSARLLAVNLANVLTVEGAYGEESVARLARRIAKLSGLVILPPVAVLAAGAGLVLRMFGSPYATAGAWCLRFFALGLIPFAVVAFASAVDRVREGYRLALLATASASACTLILDFVLLPPYGVAGAGVAWLAGQGVGAVVALIGLRGWRTAAGAADLGALDEELPTP